MNCILSIKNKIIVLTKIILSLRCTKEGYLECEKNASSYNIIPPIVTAKLTSKNHLSFLSGQLEVVAKLPSGDWIVSGK